MIYGRMSAAWSMVMRYDDERVMQNYLFVKEAGNSVVTVTTWIALRFTVITEARAKRIQDTIAESTRSIVPASDGIATL